MYTRPYPDELYHYGVKGMKWGVRRDKKRIQRSLNRLDQDFANETAKALRSGTKSKKYSDKGDETKKHKYGRRMLDSEKRMHQIDSAQSKLIAEAESKNYTVSSEKIRRDGERGKAYLAMIVGGPLGGATIAALRSAQAKDYPESFRPWDIPGNRFRVD